MISGYLLAFLLAYGFKQKGKATAAYLMILISPICSAMYPFLLIIVKVSSNMWLKYIVINLISTARSLIGFQIHGWGEVEIDCYLFIAFLFSFLSLQIIILCAVPPNAMLHLPKCSSLFWMSVSWEWLFHNLVKASKNVIFVYRDVT